MPTITLPYKTDPTAGTPISAHIQYAPASTPTPKPIILIFHAGGFAGGSVSLIPPAETTHLIETLGAIAVAVEYRLCPQVSLLEGPISDARDSLAWARTTLPSALRAATNGSVLADPARVAAMGHSAGGMLALELGNAADPPDAILDLYGIKYLATTPFWTQPFAAFAPLPDPSPDFMDRAYQGPVPLAAGELFVDGAPALGVPRTAWMIHAIKHGALYAKELKEEDGVLEVEPTRGFGAKWPPTCFVHGTADVFAPVEVAERAERELRQEGAEVELVRVEGAAHMFDIGLGPGDEAFDGPVVRALEWLVSRI
ncbi:alpha beta-hydrolase [Macrophomina phaseolina]|uniref:Alpha beta-hydrolase n=1 Tax=Macrophomina phaseolina TaxID=35725 RepID=A0ABQ8GK66_9PEZI|nr:alpha beta-hydrolase [Macrophomina phaseolina]